MLVLSRKVGEVITVGSSVKITVLGFDRGVIRLGIEAPKSIPIHRKEVYDKIIEMNQQAAKTELASLRNLISVSGLKLKKQSADSPQPPTLMFSMPKTDNLFNKE
jgi:carbon storage regulator